MRAAVNLSAASRFEISDSRFLLGHLGHGDRYNWRITGGPTVRNPVADFGITDHLVFRAVGFGLNIRTKNLLGGDNTSRPTGEVDRYGRYFVRRIV